MRLTYPFDLPILPYEFRDMEPNISEWTMKTHYERNHRVYVNKTNELTSKLPHFQKLSLAMVVSQAQGGLFNQSAQHFNHVIWWFSLQIPQLNNTPTPMLRKQIIKDFGSFENWKKDFVSKALSVFGSGWAWLVKEDEKLLNVTTLNAGVPNFANGIVPLLVCDLWEHAYFCDYTTDRKKYIENWFNCANWNMAQVRFDGKDQLFNLF